MDAQSPCLSPIASIAQFLSERQSLSASSTQGGSYQLRLATQFDREAGEMSVALIRNKYPNKEILAVR